MSGKKSVTANVVSPTNMRKRYAQSIDFMDLIEQRREAKEQLLMRARKVQGRRKRANASNVFGQDGSGVLRTLFGGKIKESE